MYRNGRDSLTLKNRFFDFSVLYPKKSGLNKKLKSSPSDIQIKQSGLKISILKFPALIVFICGFSKKVTCAFLASEKIVKSTELTPFQAKNDVILHIFHQIKILKVQQ